MLGHIAGREDLTLVGRLQVATVVHTSEPVISSVKLYEYSILITYDTQRLVQGAPKLTTVNQLNQ